MSKLFRRAAALLFAVALIVPGFLTALANPNEPNLSLLDPTENASITIHRIAGTDDTNYNQAPVAPNHALANVPIRIRQVELVAGAQPTAANLANPTWVAANVVYVTNAGGDYVVFYGLTGENGAVTFPLGTNHGFWLVQELDYLLINESTLSGSNIPAITTINAGGRAAGTRVNNPTFHAPSGTTRFNDFIVSAPRWIVVTDDEHAAYDDGGYWQYNINVWPKSDVPGPTGYYKEPVYYADGIATWELGHGIVPGLASIPHFSVTDELPAALEFVTGSVVGRFTALADYEVDDTDPLNPITTPVTNWNLVEGRLNGPDHGTPHFTVTSDPVERTVHIQLTTAGLAHLEAQGLVGGAVMFRLDTRILEAGAHINEAEWCLGSVDICSDVPPPPPIETFNLEVLKLNVADQRLDGAVFHVYRGLTAVEQAELDALIADDANTDAFLASLGSAALPAQRITVDGDVHYVVPLRTSAATPARVQGTTVNGVTRFNDAPFSSYGGSQLWLREFETPEGYRYIRPWMPITVNTATSNAARLTEVTVFNEPVSGWQLPQTGGVGTIILTVVGLALVGGALVLFVGGKKDEEVI